MLTALVLALLLAAPAGAEPGRLTVDAVPLDGLAARLAQDLGRIEVFYPKQFERLEMDWKANVRAYLARYAEADTISGKLHVLARFYNSWHNAHHRPLVVAGVEKDEPAERLGLPLRVFAQGLKLSQGRFFIVKLAQDAPPGLRVGDEVVEYAGRPVRDHIEYTRDESNSESPEAVLDRVAESMTVQKRCPWGKRVCWSDGDSLLVTVQDPATKRRTTVPVAWRPLARVVLPKPAAAPEFPPALAGWSYAPLVGTYGYSYDDTPDGEYGFIGKLEKAGRRYLLVKLFEFRGSELVQRVVREANQPGYDGVILDFGANGGGDDSAMTLLGGLLGPTFHLELSAIRLVPDFQDRAKLEEATFGKTKAKLFHPLVTASNFYKMSPFTPFGCMNDDCPPVTEFSKALPRYEQPALMPEKPLPKLALITGRGTCSKTDSIAALFKASKVGPIVGTPAMGSSGTYYYRKDYVVVTGGKAIVVGATFTPDLSIGNDCEEIQANPPQPDVPVERTAENYAYYDSLTWVKAAEALAGWTAPQELSRSCDVPRATRLLSRFGLSPAEGKASQ